MHTRIRERDLIIITDKNECKYLQVGQVIEIQNYPHSDDVDRYCVQFADEIREYRYLEDICKVLMVER